ncbi:MAG: M56 family metallopeptidase [Defluviitaleaceae bacterium]|nr:M56 family metallopeptidase [Defluviitaleaceae bacterium]
MNALFLTILNMSLTGAYVIALVYIARRLLKKAPKAISYALWAVVGFRLIFPFSIESVFSLIPFHTAPIPSDIAMQPVPQMNTGVPIFNTAVNSAVNRILPATAPHYSVNPLQVWLTLGAWVWFVVALLFMIYGIASFMILKRKMKTASWIEANIYEADHIKSPFVLGILSPKIYLPVGLSAHERGYILLHEQTHIRRGDHIVKFVAYFILCLHWFNPLAWLAFWLMGADMEMSCDERVMKELGAGISGDYSMSLVRIATGKRMNIGSPLAFSEGGIKERVKRVLNFKKPSRVVVVFAVILVAVLSTGFAFNRALRADDIVPQDAAPHDTSGLIEMEVLYVETLATFLPLIQLRWGDVVYHDISRYWQGHFNRGDEIGFALCEFSRWRVYELVGHGQEYLLIFEGDDDDVFRLMHPHLPAVLGRFVLENATDMERFTRMLSVTLYADGTAALDIPPISSFAIRHPLFFTFADNELLIHDDNHNVMARFEVIDDSTLILGDRYSSLFADIGARYVSIIDALQGVDTVASRAPVDAGTTEADNAILHYIYLEAIAPYTAIPIARVRMGEGIVYEINMEARYGDRMLTGLRRHPDATVMNANADDEPWLHLSVAPGNPRAATVPLTRPGIANVVNLNGFYYLFIANHSDDEMTGVRVRIAATHPLAEIELLYIAASE